jgi:hypothetical protein
MDNKRMVFRSALVPTILVFSLAGHSRLSIKRINHPQSLFSVSLLGERHSYIRPKEERSNGTIEGIGREKLLRPMTRKRLVLQFKALAMS